VESATSRLESGSGIAITEPFALRSGLTAGDQLRLPGDVGEHSFEIVAVYRDYDAGGAAVLMALSQFRQLWRDDSVDGIGIEVAAAADVSAVETDIARQLPQGAARITTATGIRRISLEIFDRTFLITEVLRLLAGSIAFLGMLSALMALQFARRRELGILRSLGFAPPDLRRLLITETGIIGVCAGVLAVPVGVALAALLVFVINVRSFGWTMDFQVHTAALLPGFCLAVAAAMLAGIFPALRSYKHTVADALRDV
jgi:putative ABC transport system permease protein